MSEQSNNKRIAKNTLILYVRMLFMMAVSLYTSRVVLKVLGIDDFGIYNVVGGVVALLGFINNSMCSATQRFITFALGQGDKYQLQIVFNTSIQIHGLIAFIVLILGETVGMWFLYFKMQIPPDRLNAAFWVLQCSLLSTCVGIVSVPFSADVTAHEKMSIFAYFSIYDAVMKLVIVYLLTIISFDKLIVYAFMFLLVGITQQCCYIYYCHRHFEESLFKRVWEKELFKEMTGFAGWSVFGNLSFVFYTQGLNMLLNVFFGPVVNAARAIAVQVQNAVQQFVGNFQMALNPQITKTYAQKNMDEMYNLMFRSAKFSFYLLFFLSLPVLLETNFILNIWLKTVPENTVVFLRIMICTSLIYTISNPLIIANQATGKVKKYQAVCGSTLLLILPISYVCLKFGCPAYSVFIVHFAMEAIAQLTRMIMLRPLIGLHVHDYIKNVYSYVAVVIICSSVAPLLVCLSMEDTVLRFFVVGIVCVISVSFFSYVFGLTRHEQAFVKDRVLLKLKIIHT